MKDTTENEKEKEGGTALPTKTVTLSLPLIEIDISQTVQSIFNIAEPTDHDNH